ncbi:MAG: hypothetical protein WBL54_01100 [Nitrososphaeraceae archaeon]
MMKIANITTSRVPREEPVQTLRDKGKGAFSTQNRRLTWDLVVWPMLLQLNRPYFTLNEFKIKRNEICIKYGIKCSNLRGGLVSLTYRGLLIKNQDIYLINFSLSLYLKKKVNLDYGKAFRKKVPKH